MIFIISVQGYTTPEVKKIIVFNSYHEGFPWTDGITSAIKKYFTLSDIKPELYFEYLDRKRFSDKTYIKLLPDLFFMKYRDTGIDLIIATDDDALDFLREHEKKLFPSVPVVYTGINNLVIPDIVDGRRYTGILEETPPDGTVNLIRRLHPLVNHVYVIADFGTTGRARTGSLDMIRDNYPGIYFEYSENTTIDKIKKRLASLDRRSVVLLLAFFNDSTGTFFTYEKLMSEIYPVTPVPVYAVSINLLGMGITGGVVNSFEIQGREASRIAGLILGGIKPADIPAVRDVELKTVFDYREMKRFGIKKSLLPAGSTVINEPWGFYDFYHENMVLFLLLITVSFLACDYCTGRREKQDTENKQ